jgi:hypothetical protein
LQPDFASSSAQLRRDAEFALSTRLVGDREVACARVLSPEHQE